MDHGAVEPRTPLTGRVVGQYRILELIGRGGMGEVYRAMDQNLDRTVAVKALSEKLAGDSTARSRFLRETRVACQVVHPYVATVFDVVDQQHELFLVMELIQGRLLSRILREESPALEQRMAWALEITEALAAIHKHGLIHRDLKPGNVMITPEGHVKVMDFGLARPVTPEDVARSEVVTAETTLTRDGAGVGTLLYMSPEQLRGERADQHSDLFSLGVVIYQALTGAHPFERKSVHETVAAILHDPPGSGSDEKELSRVGPVREAVLRLLEKDPRDRYDSAEMLLHDLRSGSQPVGLRAVLRSRRSARRVAGALAATVVLAALAIVAWQWLNVPPDWNRARFRIALAPVVDRSGEQEGDLRAEQLGSFLATALESSWLVRVSGTRETTSLLERLPPDPPVSEIVAGISGRKVVDYVVLATLYREQGRYLAALESRATGENLPDLPALRAEGATIGELAESLAWKLKRALPEVSLLTAWRDDPVDLDEIHSGSVEARMHYERGMQAFGRFDLDAAIESFERATTADPSYALAWARLAEALNGALRGREARDAVTRARSLLAEPHSRATERLWLLVTALHAELFHRPDEAVAATARLVAAFPDEPGVLSMHAWALDHSGRSREALGFVADAERLDPETPSRALQHAILLIYSGRFEEALAALDLAGERFARYGSEEGAAEVEFRRGQALGLLERFTEAGQAFARAGAALRDDGRRVRAAEVDLYAGQQALVRGDTKLAEDRILAAESVAREAGAQRLLCEALAARGALLFRRGDHAAAERTLREGSDLARQLQSDALLVQPLANLATLLVAIGRLGDARDILPEVVEVSRQAGRRDSEAVARFSLADLRYQTGDLDGAIDGYESLLADFGSEGTSRMLAWVRLGVAEIREVQGRSAAALSAADRALGMFDELGLASSAAHARIQRGRILAALGRAQEARSEVEAGCLVGRSGNMSDLIARCRVARARLERFAGNWPAAEREADGAVSSEPGRSPVVVVMAGLEVCEAALEAGRTGDAVARCRSAVRVDRAPVALVTTARALLGEALLANGRSESARDAAEAALAESARMGLLLPRARASAAMLHLPPALRTESAAEIRASGRAALDGYIAAAPEGDRAAVEARPDLRRLSAALAAPESARANSPPRPPGT